MESSWNLVSIWAKLPSTVSNSLIHVQSFMYSYFIHKLTAVWSKSTLNSMTIPCHLSRFHLFFMLKHDTDFGQVQVMEFPGHLLRKWWDLHRIWCHFRPNCRQKDMEKSLLHFLQGKQNKINNIFSCESAFFLILYSSWFWSEKGHGRPLTNSQLAWSLMRVINTRHSSNTFVVLYFVASEFVTMSNIKKNI